MPLSVGKEPTIDLNSSRGVAFRSAPGHIEPMFGSLFGRRKAEISKPSAPDGTRIYAIGDLHGSVDTLRDMHDLIS